MRVFPLFPPFFVHSPPPSRLQGIPSNHNQHHRLHQHPYAASAAAKKYICPPSAAVPFDRYHHFGGTRTSTFDFFPPKWSGALTSNFCSRPPQILNPLTVPLTQKRRHRIPSHAVGGPPAFFRVFTYPSPLMPPPQFRQPLSTFRASDRSYVRLVFPLYHSFSISRPHTPPIDPPSDCPHPLPPPHARFFCFSREKPNRTILKFLYICHKSLLLSSAALRF